MWRLPVSRLPIFLSYAYRIARINISIALCPRNPNWKIANTMDDHCFYLHTAHEWAKRIKFFWNPSKWTWYILSLPFLREVSREIKKKETFDCLQLKLIFSIQPRRKLFADKSDASVIVFPQRQLRICEWKFRDSPRFVRRNCDGALGAISSGASSMKLVVQILSFPAKVPTECRRACDDAPSTAELELCDKL